MIEPPPRVVITGIGLITGLGADRESTWTALKSGDGAVRWIDAAELQKRCGVTFPADERTRYLGAPVSWLAEEGPIHPFEEEPNIRLAVQAANEAVTDARLHWEDVEPIRRGCVIGTSKGGMKSIARAIAQPTDATADFWPMFWPNTPALQVADRWNIRGPVLCPVAACATGLMSLCRGAELIQEGTCDVVLAGSTDASLQPAVLGAFSRMGVLAKPMEDASGACRPFDRHRTGFVVGEGAAVLILEREDIARNRGVVPYAEWLAGGFVSDPTGIAHLDETGASLTWLMQDVLRRAAVRVEVIDYLNLHGTGTRDNDRTETRAIRAALGPHADRVACSSLKGAFGHLLGAAGSVETACTLLAMRDQIVPPTRNYRQPDPDCDLNYTPNFAQQRRIRHAMKLSLGFGGHQVAALFRRYD